MLSRFSSLGASVALLSIFLGSPSFAAKLPQLKVIRMAVDWKLLELADATTAADLRVGDEIRLTQPGDLEIQTSEDFDGRAKVLDWNTKEWTKLSSSKSWVFLGDTYRASHSLLKLKTRISDSTVEAVPAHFDQAKLKVQARNLKVTGFSLELRERRDDDHVSVWLIVKVKDSAPGSPIQGIHFYKADHDHGGILTPGQAPSKEILAQLLSSVRNTTPLQDLVNVFMRANQSPIVLMDFHRLKRKPDPEGDDLKFIIED